MISFSQIDGVLVTGLVVIPGAEPITELTMPTTARHFNEWRSKAEVSLSEAWLTGSPACLLEVMADGSQPYLVVAAPDVSCSKYRTRLQSRQ